MSKLTLAEILEMFQNGEQRYDNNAYFKEVVLAIAAGLSPTVVLDRVLKEHVILMHLHNEQINKNKVAISEVARLTDRVAEVVQFNNEVVEANQEWADTCDSLRAEVLELKKNTNLI